MSWGYAERCLPSRSSCMVDLMSLAPSLAGHSRSGGTGFVRARPHPSPCDQDKGNPRKRQDRRRAGFRFNAIPCQLHQLVPVTLRHKSSRCVGQRLLYSWQPAGAHFFRHGSRFCCRTTARHRQPSCRWNQRPGREFCPAAVTLSRDEATSESGLGPAWIRPSWRIETSENGEAAARSSRARSFGCRPSPRDAAKPLN